MAALHFLTSSYLIYNNDEAKLGLVIIVRYDDFKLGGFHELGIPRGGASFDNFQIREKFSSFSSDGLGANQLALQVRVALIRNMVRWWPGTMPETRGGDRPVS